MALRCSGLSLTTRSIRRASILSGTAATAMPQETPHRPRTHPTQPRQDIYLSIYPRKKRQISLAAAGGRSGRKKLGAPMYPGRVRSGGGWNRICWGQARERDEEGEKVVGSCSCRNERTTVCGCRSILVCSLSAHSPLSPSLSLLLLGVLDWRCLAWPPSLSSLLWGQEGDGMEPPSTFFLNEPQGQQIC